MSISGLGGLIFAHSKSIRYGDRLILYYHRIGFLSIAVWGFREEREMAWCSEAMVGGDVAKWIRR